MKKRNHFFAYMARMKLIRRWSLMKSVDDENIAEHSAQVAQIAHALALIKNQKFGGTLDAERIRFEVEDGDVVVQVSDGITGGDEGCPWLCQMLVEKWDGDAERFARMALNRAASMVEDDLSILITEIRKSDPTTEENTARQASA